MLEKLQTLINYKATNPHWLEVALTHKSFDRDGENNERLEFIGDAVIDCVVADILFDKYPDDDEGGLSRKRAALVNEESLYNLAMRLKLDECIQVSGGEAESLLRTNKRILSGSLEAVIGAIYKDAGFATAYEWVRNLYGEQGSTDFSQYDFEKDYKTRFQEIIQEKLKITPVYRQVGISGPDHQKVFTVQVMVGDEVYGEGSGESKKTAAQVAAQAALLRLGHV
jgi:ribonuclease-3